jgi:hypothetical protein
MTKPNEAPSNEQEVENIAESCGLWPRHDDIQQRFLDGADMRQSLQEFASKLRAPLLVTIAQLKEAESSNKTLRKQYFMQMCEAIEKNDALIAQLSASQEQVKILRDKMTLLSKYVAYNGDDWVQREALEALAATATASSDAWLKEQKAKVLEDAAEYVGRNLFDNKQYAEELRRMAYDLCSPESDTDQATRLNG